MPDGTLGSGHPLQLIDQGRRARYGRKIVVLHVQNVQGKKVDLAALASAVEFFHQARGDDVGVDDVIVEPESRDDRRLRMPSDDGSYRLPAMTSTAV